MRKYILLISITIFTVNVFADDHINFVFSDGISDVNLKSKMESNVSKLLTAINFAEKSKSNINYSGIDIDMMASQSIGMLWNNVHFRVIDNNIVEHCLTLGGKGNSPLRGYEVRNIALKMEPIDNTYNDNLYQEACIEFDTKGKIVDFNLSMGVKQYAELMKKGIELGDLDKREQIIDFCEQFRTAYNKKDIKFLEDIFSNDALIITGRVLQHAEATMNDPSERTLKKINPETKRPDNNSPKIVYKSQSKEEYLENLRSTFSRNAYINVDFTNYKVVQHETKPNFYGVTLFQKWNSSKYSDEGIVFLVWDFKDEEHPKIHVRTWQPMEAAEKNKNGQDQIFRLTDFKLSNN